MSLPTVRFGNSSLQVTQMGLGLAALGRPGYITLSHGDDIVDHDVATMESHAHAVLDAAWQAGIRYFDAARSYGKAEQFLGRWLQSREIDRAEVIIGSKWGYTYTADWQVNAETHEVKEHSLAVLQRQWAETQSFLGYSPNLYQIHSATLDTGVLDNHAVLNELGKLKANGTLIGLTLSGANQTQTLEKALGVLVDGMRLFDSVQVTWNLLERSTTEMLRQAHRLGLAVIVKEAVANGRLTASNHAQEFAPQMKLLKAEATRLDTTIDALALAAVLAQEWATIVLSGAANSHHLEANVKAFNVQWDEIAENTLASLEEAPEVYWNARSQLSWN